MHTFYSLLVSSYQLVFLQQCEALRFASDQPMSSVSITYLLDFQTSTSILLPSFSPLHSQKTNTDVIPSQTSRWTQHLQKNLSTVTLLCAEIIACHTDQGCLFVSLRPPHLSIASSLILRLEIFWDGDLSFCTAISEIVIIIMGFVTN